MTIQAIDVGSVDGRPIEAFDLAQGGTRIRLFMTLGAVLNQVWRPDRHGHEADIVLGYDQPGDYLRNRGNVGAVCGRHANRLASGRFTLDGIDYQLALMMAPITSTAVRMGWASASGRPHLMPLRRPSASI